MVDAVERALTNALAAGDSNARVLREPDLLLGTHTVTIPDLAIFRDGSTCDVPHLVIEYRAESTDRLFYGPKRLVYARAGVPEVWFAEPTSGTITVLRAHGGREYSWPAPTYGEGASVEAVGLGITLAVDAFFAEHAAR
jgi:Uma2 family endonuclease